MGHYLILGSVHRQKTKPAGISPAGMSYSQSNVCRYHYVGNSLAWSLTAGYILPVRSRSQSELGANNTEPQFATFKMCF